MQLRSLVNTALQAVNADQQITWLASTGYTKDSTTGAVTPTYSTQVVPGQVQPLPTDRLQQLANLNIQGVLRQVYLKGAVASAVREDGTGGDLLQFPETPGAPVRSWLVMLVDEQWPDFCRVTVRLQAN